MRRIETEQCNLGHEHVVKEEYYCDYCKGLITEATPKTINWFGKGLVSEVKEFRPAGGGPRQIITVVYQPVLAGMQAIELHFCSFSHALAYLRNPPKGALPGDQIQIGGTIESFSQTPLEIPRDRQIENDSPGSIE